MASRMGVVCVLITMLVLANVILGYRCTSNTCAPSIVAWTFGTSSADSPLPLTFRTDASMVRRTFRDPQVQSRRIPTRSCAVLNVGNQPISNCTASDPALGLSGVLRPLSDVADVKYLIAHSSGRLNAI